MEKDNASLKNRNKPRKQTEEAFRKTEEQYRALVENVPDIIMRFDKDYRYLYVNQSVEKVVDIKAESFIGKTPGELGFPLHKCQYWEECIQQVFESGKPFNQHFEYEGQSCSIIFDWRLIPEFDAEGSVQTVLSIARDVTDHRQVEKALQESEQRYRRLTEAVTDYIYTVRIQDEHPIETTHSSACAAVTGYTTEEFQENPYLWIEMVYEDDRELVRNLVADILSGLQVKPLEHRIIRKDSTLRWVRDTTVLHYDSQGKLVSYDGLIQDVTERKQMEIALEEERTSLAQKVEERTDELSRANAELTRAARLKDEFLATMSHELRTPLNVVLGMSGALQDGIYGPLNEKQLNALYRITEGGHHLLAIIIDILDLSQISIGRMEVDIGPVAVESVCQAGLRFINRLVQKKKLKLAFMFDSAVTTIHTDGRRLKQVLVNLLDNAVKFTPEGGKISLDVEGDAENFVVRFIVWDTGIGIAKEDMERLFQPFVQLDSTLSRKYEGTGLGLILVYRIVDILGGSVSVESEVGQGSRFMVSLPWEESEDREIGRAGDREIGRAGDRESIDNTPHLPITPSPHLPISPSPQSSTILIADDNERTIRTLSRYFVLKGYRLKIAHNGWEAFAYTRETRPDLILMDIQMPEMDGLEAIRHIRADKYGHSIPIIALTALAMPGDQEKCLEAGADVYLIKPVSPRRLSEIIKTFLSGKK